MGINIKKAKALAFAIISSLSIVIAPLASVGVAHAAASCTVSVDSTVLNIASTGTYFDIGITATNTGTTTLTDLQWDLDGAVAYYNAVQASSVVSGSWTKTSSHDFQPSSPLVAGATVSGVVRLYVQPTSPLSDYNYRINGYYNSWASMCATGANNLIHVNDTYNDMSPPTAPVITGTTGNHQVYLTWPAVTFATSYKIYQDSVLIATQTGNSITVTSLDNGRLYNFYVTALNTLGTSGSSNVLQLTPISPVLTTSPDATFGDRDIKIISFGIACFIGYLLIRPFRWRSRD